MERRQIPRAHGPVIAILHDTAEALKLRGALIIGIDGDDLFDGGGILGAGKPQAHRLHGLQWPSPCRVENADPWAF